MAMTFKDMEGGVKGKFPLAPAGVRPSRIKFVVDIGVQKREWQGEVKAPARQLFLGLELVNDEYESEGEKYRHRIYPRQFNVMSDAKSALVKFLKSVDPQGKLGGDFSKLANLPIMANVIHTTKMKDGNEVTYANFGGGMPGPEGFPIKDLSDPAVVFSFDEPTEASYKALPGFIRDKLKAAVNYPGSKVEVIAKKVDVEADAAKGKPAF